MFSNNINSSISCQAIGKPIYIYEWSYVQLTGTMRLGLLLYTYFCVIILLYCISLHCNNKLGFRSYETVFEYRHAVINLLAKPLMVRCKIGGCSRIHLLPWYCVSFSLKMRNLLDYKNSSLRRRTLNYGQANLELHMGWQMKQWWISVGLDMANVTELLQPKGN